MGELLELVKANPLDHGVLLQRPEGAPVRRQHCAQRRPSHLRHLPAADRNPMNEDKDSEKY